MLDNKLITLVTVKLQVALSKQGVLGATLQAMRMLTANPQEFSNHSAADFAKQVSSLNEEAALQVNFRACYSHAVVILSELLLAAGDVSGLSCAVDVAAVHVPKACDAAQ